jgi:hypothetical protein
MRASNMSVFMLLGSQKAVVVGCRDYISQPQRSGPYAVLKVELGGIENMLCIRSQRLARCIWVTSKSTFASIRGDSSVWLSMSDLEKEGCKDGRLGVWMLLLWYLFILWSFSSGCSLSVPSCFGWSDS